MKINNATATKKSKKDAINLIMALRLFTTKREMGCLKAIHFKIPVLRDYGNYNAVMTI